jgi:acetyltransferase-like isoleucine patch superfamily enzyme
VEPAGKLVIGSDCILVGAIFMCAGEMRIGDRVVISYNTTLADSDFHPVDPAERRRDAMALSPSGNKAERPLIITQPIDIGNDVWIGIGAMILKGVKIGSGARIHPGAVVTRDVPSGAHVRGNPAKVFM